MIFCYAGEEIKLKCRIKRRSKIFVAGKQILIDPKTSLFFITQTLYNQYVRVLNEFSHEIGV